MSKDLTESRILTSDDLASLELALQREIENVGKQLTKWQAELARHKATLTKIHRLRVNSDNGAEGDLGRSASVITNILREAGEPLAKREIRARYGEIEGKEIPVSVIESCLYYFRDQRFRVVGERAAAKWEVIENAE